MAVGFPIPSGIGCGITFVSASLRQASYRLISKFSFLFFMTAFGDRFAALRAQRRLQQAKASLTRQQASCLEPETLFRISQSPEAGEALRLWIRGSPHSAPVPR